MAQAFGIGSSVRLNNSPLWMIVEDYQDGLVICTWQDKDGKPQRKAYPESALTNRPRPSGYAAGGEPPPTTPPGLNF